MDAHMHACKHKHRNDETHQIQWRRVEAYKKVAGLYFTFKVLIGVLPDWLLCFLLPYMVKPFWAFSDKTVQEVLDEITPDKELQTVESFCFFTTCLPLFLVSSRRRGRNLLLGCWPHYSSRDHHSTPISCFQVLTYFWGNYGLQADEASFAIHCMVQLHYINGGAYPVGGSSKIAQNLVQVHYLEKY